MFPLLCIAAEKMELGTEGMKCSDTRRTAMKRATAAEKNGSVSNFFCKCLEVLIFLLCLSFAAFPPFCGV